MKLNGKNLPAFIGLLCLGMFIGTLAWEVLERIAAGAGYGFSFSTDPLGFDAGVLAVWVKANPGTLLGIPGSVLLYNSL